MALVEEGVGCSLVVTTDDWGRNLFSHLDRNNDGKLDLFELTTAAREFGDRRSWTREQIPLFVEVSVQLGFAESSFGPVPLAKASKAAPAGKLSTATKGPAWFQAMDKNGDGFLSPREFLGPIDLFMQLDENRDGRISVDEAERADLARKDKTP